MNCSYTYEDLTHNEFNIDNYPIDIDTNYINFCKTNKCNIMNNYKTDDSELSVSREADSLMVRLDGVSNSKYFEFKDHQI